MQRHHCVRITNFLYQMPDYIYIYRERERGRGRQKCQLAALQADIFDYPYIYIWIVKNGSAAAKYFAAKILYPQSIFAAALQADTFVYLSPYIYINKEADVKKPLVVFYLWVMNPECLIMDGYQTIFAIIRIAIPRKKDINEFNIDKCGHLFIHWSENSHEQSDIIQNTKRKAISLIQT